MNLDALTDNPQAIIAICAALSVFSAIVVLSWPYLARDELGSRMRQISSERERIRAALPQLRRSPFERLLPPRADCHVGAFLREPQGGRAPDPLRAAGHYGDLAFESQLHIPPSSKDGIVEQARWLASPIRAIGCALNATDRRTRRGKLRDVFLLLSPGKA